MQVGREVSIVWLVSFGCASVTEVLALVRCHFLLIRSHVACVFNLTSMEVHGHVVAAFSFFVKDVRTAVCFENWETKFPYSRCIRQGSVETPVLWEKVAEYLLWNAEENGRPRVGIWFGRQGDDEYRLSSMMRTDNSWLFSDDGEKKSMLRDNVEELIDLDMELKPESLWWMSTYEEEKSGRLSRWRQKGKLGDAVGGSV